MNRAVTALFSAVLLGITFWAGRYSVSSDSSEDGAATTQTRSPRTSQMQREQSQGLVELRSRFKLGEKIRSKEDATERFRVIFREDDHNKRMAIFLMMLAEADLDEVLALGEGLSVLAQEGMKVNQFGEPITRRKGALQGESGMAGLLPKEPNGAPNWNVKQRVEGWATANPAESWAWLEGLEEGDVKNRLKHAWHKGVFLAGSDAIHSSLATLPEVQQQRLMKRVVGDVVMHQGLESVSNWYEEHAKTLPSSVQNQAFKEIVTTYARGRSNWQEAVGFMEKFSEPDSKQFADGLKSIVWLTGAKSPDKTLDLLNQYAPENTHLYQSRNEYIQNAIYWASTSTVTAVGDWLSANQNSPLYDDVTVNYVRKIDALDPESARAWAETIKDRATQAAVLKELAH